jgi:hypothetical protein
VFTKLSGLAEKQLPFKNLFLPEAEWSGPQMSLISLIVIFFLRHLRNLRENVFLN